MSTIIKLIATVLVGLALLPFVRNDFNNYYCYDKEKQAHYVVKTDVEYGFNPFAKPSIVVQVIGYNLNVQDRAPVSFHNVKGQRVFFLENDITFIEGQVLNADNNRVHASCRITRAL